MESRDTFKGARTVNDVAVLKVTLTYAIISSAVLVLGYLFQTGALLMAYDVPISFSLVLLVPVYIWQRNYRKRTQLSTEVNGRDAKTILFWIFALFTMAMIVRIPSALAFGIPYEKTPLIYLTILAILIVEKTDITAFGFKTKNIWRSIAYGMLFSVLLTGTALFLLYYLVYAFTSQMPIQTYEVLPFFLVMPFMTFCVGISEEGLFRGYMQTHLEKLHGSGKAILIQAILFGAWHFVWNLSPFEPFAMAEYVAVTFFIGLLFGYFYSKVRNLIPLVMAHGLWNSVPQGIVRDLSAFQALETIPLQNQILVLILPYLVSMALAFLFTRYLVTEN